MADPHRAAPAAVVEIETDDWGVVPVANDDLEVLASATGLSRDLCIERLRRTRLSDIADEWRGRAPSTPSAILDFYSQTDKYLWELLLWNATDDYRRAYGAAVERMARRWPPARHPRALDYGSGIGTIALQLAALGYRVTIADVAGKTLEFADARLRSRGVDHDVIEVREHVPALAKSNWDVVVCFDVFEHVPEPEQLARALADSLVPAGGAAFIADFESAGEHYPQHLDDPRRRLSGHRWALFLSSLGLSPVDRSLYCKKHGPSSLLMRLRYSLWRRTGVYVSRPAR